MWKRVVSRILLTLLLIGMLTLAFDVQPVKAYETIYIRVDGSVEPSTANITSADNVTYVFTNNNYDSIVVERSNIIIDGVGHTVEGNGIGIGFRLISITNVTIKNTTIKGFYQGLYLQSTSNNTVSGNNITNNDNGIWLQSTSNNTVSGNNITNNDDGIYHCRSVNNTISGNNITNNIYAIFHCRFVNDTIFCGNSISNNVYGIYLRVCSNNSLVGNSISNNDYGIYLSECVSNTISGNNITANNVYGVYLSGSLSNSLVGNNITNNVYGTYLSGSSNNSLVGNNITANNNDGVYLSGSVNNTISGNNITANNVYGVHLSECVSNTISGNNITNNDNGICLYSSSNNIFYSNNFIDNNQQVYTVTPDYANFWDYGYPSGGNYWSDYNGVDLNHDGVGDVAYIIDANNTDHYPLIGMFSSFNTFLGHLVNVISNSTIEDFEYLESNSTIRMHVSGEEGIGFCRVSIPHVLMNVSDISVIIDDGSTPVLHPNYTLYDNGTHRWIYFAYEHSIHEIDIIPEFPTLIIPPLFMIITLITITVCLFGKNSFDIIKA